MPGTISIARPMTIAAARDDERDWCGDRIRHGAIRTRRTQTAGTTSAISSPTRSTPSRTTSARRPPTARARSRTPGACSPSRYAHGGQSRTPEHDVADRERLADRDASRATPSVTRLRRVSSSPSSRRLGSAAATASRAMSVTCAAGSVPRRVTCRSSPRSDRRRARRRSRLQLGVRDHRLACRASRCRWRRACPRTCTFLPDSSQLDHPFPTRPVPAGVRDLVAAQPAVERRSSR